MAYSGSHNYFAVPASDVQTNLNTTSPAHGSAFDADTEPIIKEVMRFYATLKQVSVRRSVHRILRAHRAAACGRFRTAP